MRTVICLALPLLLLLSCSKNNDFPHVENIIKGSKWTLKIGSTPEDVYAQLQSLGKEKNLNSVALVYRKPYSRPEDIKNVFVYYNAVTLQSNSGRIDRAVIHFDHNKVSAVKGGGGLLDSLFRWPQNYPEQMAIQKGDSMDGVYEKLVKIYQVPAYQDYQIILPDKPLNLPYDPDMANYEEWALDFSEDLGNGRSGQHAVRLYFDHHKLVKIKVSYQEMQGYN